jgi:hypothetical protein
VNRGGEPAKTALGLLKLTVPLEDLSGRPADEVAEIIGSFLGRHVAMAIFRQTENGTTDGAAQIIETSSSKQTPESPPRAGARPEDKVPIASGKTCRGGNAFPRPVRPMYASSEISSSRSGSTRMRNCCTLKHD